MTSSRLDHIFHSSSALADPIHITGLTLGGQALLAVQWFFTQAHESNRSPLIVVCPSSDFFSSLKEDIETLSRSLFHKTLRVSIFPPWDQSPFSTITPSIRVRLRRISTLYQVFSPAPPQIILTTLDAGWMNTLSPSTLAQFSISLKVGQSLGGRNVLSQQLTESGYQQVDPVEDPGTFSVRGDIIDVFPPHLKTGVRIELWGDQIDQIRYFNPETQRTEESEIAHTIEFGPAREVLIHSKNDLIIKEQIKSRADLLGIPRSIRDPILDNIYPGTSPSHSEFWAPFAYSDTTPFFRLFPIQQMLVLDELSCQQHWDQFYSELREGQKENKKIFPSLDQLIQTPENPILSILPKKILFSDQIELSDLSVVESMEEIPPSEMEETPRIHHRTWIKKNNTSKLSLSEFEKAFPLWKKQGFRVVVFSPALSQLERLEFLFKDKNIPFKRVKNTDEDLFTPGVLSLVEGTLSEGFRWPSEGWIIYTAAELLGGPNKVHRRALHSPSPSTAKNWSNLKALSDLSVGDLVVHIDHGLGKYQGLVRLNLSGAPGDFLLLEYANHDKLYLPIYRLNVIQKHSGGHASPSLDRLGSLQFSKTKEKVKEEVKKIAFDLIDLYAKRKIKPGIPITPRDSLFREFEDLFPFHETPDQMKAIDSVLNDLSSGTAMDRLICGDVGYGKTEVAIRAAFKTISDGHQVAVLAPTTILAHQHEQSFKERMKNFPIKIESVSRFKTQKEQKQILASAAEGGVDLIIGTHRLLSKDVRFKSLGLVIIDEEHRFGVEHKEKLKTLRINTHVLSLSATPIPRTLHMALSGLRDISLITTAPINRLPIRTYISKFDEDLIRRAIEAELSRGGQVFFVHNRIESIYEIAKKIQDLVKHARVSIGHGQMSEKELEKIMADFYEKKTNVLVSTTIIESGLDIPSANTIIINRADHFGLAQLYQLRGRVGRSETRAYAYLLLPQEAHISDDAKKRLEVVQKFIELGSGFNIASHDLEIRGGGDLLGASQSGHISAVGLELYTELLESAIQEMRGLPLSSEEIKEPEIKTPFPAFLSEEYVPDVHQRLSLYRRLSGTTTEQEIDEIELELKDRYGTIPEEGIHLLWLIRIKRLLKELRVDAITVGNDRWVLTPGENSLLDPVRAIALTTSQPQKYKLTPESKFISLVKILSLKDLYFHLQALLQEMQFER